MSNEYLDFLANRRSVLIKNLSTPGPSNEEINKILQVALRVPDHKVQSPWRFVVFDTQKSREAFGDILQEVYLKKEPSPTDKQSQIEQERFLRAPLVIAVISSLNDERGVPEWEQFLSAGAVCQNLINAVSALGFSSQWVTEWYAFDDQVASKMGLSSSERIAGFIYIGTAKEQPNERRRPQVEDVTTFWEA